MATITTVKFHSLLCTFGLFLVFFLTKTAAYTEVTTGYPAMVMEYRVWLEALKENCFYQYTYKGAVFFVDFHVIRGGDAMAKFQVKDPQGLIVLPYEFKVKASYTTESAKGGWYALCIENDSKFAGKLISIYMATYEHEGWDKFVKDFEEIAVNAANFTQTFTTVSERVLTTLNYLYQSKSLEARDFAILQDINFSIGFWSSIQFVIILGSGAFQVYKIRQFFRETPAHGKYKVRL